MLRRGVFYIAPQQADGCGATNPKIDSPAQLVDATRTGRAMATRFIYVTAANPEQAKSIGEALVAERLAACANILAPMASIYRWQGKIRHDTEAVLIAKTRADLVERVIARVRALHTYTVPCVVSLAIEAGNPDFLQWIADETAPASAAPSGGA
jgi:periplasmic divalent cation tolerance protein